MNKIVILSALTLEQNAVVNRLTNINDYIHPVTGSIYRCGTLQFPGKKIEITAGRTNQTNVNAAVETERILNHFQPDYIFFVGVAGGLKDVQVGDVVIGSEVVGYERGKEKDEFLPRIQFGFSSYELEQQAVNFSQSEKWKQKVASLGQPPFPGTIHVHAGTIASGEKVIASTKAKLYEFIKTNFSNALAVEMEGLGFLEACRPYPAVKSLLLRGISDLVDSKENSDAEGSQPYASNNVTEFLFGLLETMSFSSVASASVAETLLEILPKLYPAGLRDREVWARSNGDLSTINLFTPGKTQWFEGLDIIKKGGGGDITFSKLIKTVKTDFPNNVSVAFLPES